MQPAPSKADPVKTPRAIQPYLVLGGLLALAGMIFFGSRGGGGQVERTGAIDPVAPAPSSTVSPLAGESPAMAEGPTVSDLADPKERRLALLPKTWPGGVELSALSRETLAQFQERGQRLDRAGELAKVPDERSPADAELLEDLEIHEIEASFDHAQLERDLIEAEDSVRMFRDFYRAVKER
jgi:hypothetical protein